MTHSNIQITMLRQSKNNYMLCLYCTYVTILYSVLDVYAMTVLGECPDN